MIQQVIAPVEINNPRTTNAKKTEKKQRESRADSAEQVVPTESDRCGRQPIRAGTQPNAQQTCARPTNVSVWRPLGV